MCDACAYGLSFLGGAPQCELFWPQADRDRAVEAAAAFLTDYGHRIRPADVPLDLGGCRSLAVPMEKECLAALDFPVRDRPATPDEVRKHDAIFSLAGQGPSRVCKTVSLPLLARWKTLKDYPVFRQGRPRTEYWDELLKNEQQGVVWQAEEVQTAGSWRRCYGFVGAHQLVKVPAEEIEFVGWTEMGWAEIPINESFAAGWRDDGLKPQPSVPWVLRVAIRNTTGMDRPAPRVVARVENLRPEPGAIVIGIELLYLNVPDTWWAWDMEHTPWPPLRPTSPKQLLCKRPARELGPGEEFELVRCDLKSLFGPLQPGNYKIRLTVFGKGKPTVSEIAAFCSLPDD